MKNTLPRPRQKKVANLNTFTLQFTTKAKEDNVTERIGLQMKFEAQKSLMENDEITPLGFTMLIGSLTDTILSLAQQANEQGLNSLKLLADAGKRMGMVIAPVEQPKEQAKIIGIGKPKIIVN